MADSKQIIALYSELAEQPSKDFGWAKGLDNAKAHGYSSEWIKTLPSEVWDYCAAVGNPFSLGKINEGETVVDLGCGAGVDLLVSALKVGESGSAIGVDITPKMVEKARYYAELGGFHNIEVLESSFDNIDIKDESADVVISNGAINLTVCKERVFSEIYRILKPDGRLMFADMIDISEIEDVSCSEDQSSCCNFKEEDWANCVAGTLRKEELIKMLQTAGFSEVECVNINHYTTAETTRGATFRAIKIPSVKVREDHWNNIFNTKDYTQVLWHQAIPDISLKQIETFCEKGDPIIDVGCGASLLADELIAKGYQKLFLLDGSDKSLDIVKKRLGEKADLPVFIHSDIVEYTPIQQFKVWHDRAMFHFLVKKQDRIKYFEVLKESLLPDGIAIINTFALDGEKECAGLDIIQYDACKIAEDLPSGLSLANTENFTHLTPKNTEQKYSSFFIKKAKSI